MKIVTWNVNGARAREAQILELLAQQAPDVLCLQEVKATPEQLPASLYGLLALPDYHAHWHGTAGYSGVAVLLKKTAFPSQPRFSHPPFDVETRVVEARVDDRVFLTMYAPNGGKDYDGKLVFFKALLPYVEAAAKEGTELCIAGDINIAFADIDVHAKERKKDLIGQREEERALFRALLDKGKLMDVGRKLWPDDDQLFSWWPYWREARAKNVGWRIDYVLASETLAARAKTAVILREFGSSDHAPVVVEFEL